MTEKNVIKVEEDTLERLRKFSASYGDNYDSLINDLLDGKTLQLDATTNESQNEVAVSTTEKSGISFPIRKIIPDVTHARLAQAKIGDLVLDNPNWVDIVVELLRIAKENKWKIQQLRNYDIRVYNGPREDLGLKYIKSLRMSIPPLNAKLACSYIDRLSDLLFLQVRIKWKNR